eukprot:TRINITY_DN29063_c0_g1_i1.p1 TRINITY_DN29063_c0_g1~~TRINITY_DN29063_c0_g1_i1.p1  ORF type:complete len:247 (+),score=50.72 TRINITY_DN29063_c0_g1_i1:180-920(+)
MVQLMKVLVVGSTRGVGFKVTQLLLGNPQQYEVYALVRSLERASKAFGEAAPKIKFIEGDITKKETLQPACMGMDGVVCTVGATAGWRIPGYDQSTPKHVDFLGVKNLSEAAALAKVSRFILVSSLGTSRPWFPISILLNTLMGKMMINKAKGENALREVCKNYENMTYYIVRPGGLTNEDGGQHCLVIDQGDKGSGMISREDVARVVLECVNGRCTSNCSFEIWSSKEAGPTDFSKLSQLVPDKL